MIHFGFQTLCWCTAWLDRMAWMEFGSSLCNKSQGFYLIPTYGASNLILAFWCYTSLGFVTVSGWLNVIELSIYARMCVCVCVCVWVGPPLSFFVVGVDIFQPFDRLFWRGTDWKWIRSTQVTFSNGTDCVKRKPSSCFFYENWLKI